LTNFEDHFVERKSAGDSKDWLKTAVGFANSVPVGYPAILFVGVKDGGEIEGRTNLDSLQQSFSKVVNEAYPPIYYTSKIISRDGKQCLAIIIPGSAFRPYFAGHSYVREGSQTKKASELQFANLISQRSSKTYEVQRWKGKAVTVQFPRYELVVSGTVTWRTGERLEAVVKDCNHFYVVLQDAGNTLNPTILSFPLSFVEITYDGAKDRMELFITQHFR
jgi:hypothetical protein